MAEKEVKSTKSVKSVKEPEVMVGWKPTATPIPLAKFVEDTADTHKTIVFGESNVGKTRWYLLILRKLKELGVPPEKVKMCIIYPDRRTGLSKLAGLVPPEYYNHGCVDVFPVSNYEELITATATAEKILSNHYQKTGTHGWMVHELLGEPWVFSQDYYVRKSYGESLADYFATKKQLDKAVREDASAYRALDGWKDWSVIKLFHNFGWADKIKRMPFNVIFTAEVKPEGREDSIFSATGKPAGEKEGIHRVDEIVFLSREGNNFFEKAIKLTGYTHVYPKQNITGKNGFGEHLRMLKKLEDSGYKESPIQTLEKKAGITPPKPPKKTEDKQQKEKAEKPGSSKAQEPETPTDQTSNITKKEEAATIKVISGGKGKKETETKITKKELTTAPKKEKEEKVGTADDFDEDWG